MRILENITGAPLSESGAEKFDFIISDEHLYFMFNDTQCIQLDPDDAEIIEIPAEE